MAMCLSIGEPRLILGHTLLRRNDREKEIRRPLGAEVQRRLPGEKFARPIALVVVQERPAPSELVFEI